MSDQTAALLSKPIPLSTPIKRGETEIAEVTLRKPKAGELRGTSIQELMGARVSAVLDVLPRITMPNLTQPEVDALETEDVAAFAGAIIDFFLSPADRLQMERMLKG